MKKFSAAMIVILGMVMVGTWFIDHYNRRPFQQDYLRTVYSPLHFKPAIERARDDQCLACHREVMTDRVRERSPAGVAAIQVKAWYQELSTYQGEQDTFHRRHLSTPMARSLMNLRCTTCHQGQDPRDEAPGTSASNPGGELVKGFTLRKQVNPETTCLQCHGQFPWKVMGLPGSWHQIKDAMQNNCLTCHATIRTHRHQVNFLNAAAIEQAGKANNDVCFGCHGGRSWYRTSFPYARHPWPGMPAELPDWAKGRPTDSELRFLVNYGPTSTSPQGNH